MKILVVGDAAHVSECRLKFPDHDLQYVGSYVEAGKMIGKCDVIFDFIIDRNPAQFPMYAEQRLVVFLNTTMTTLGSLAHSNGGQMQCTAFGFNGFPTLFNREVLEVCVWQKDQTAKLEELCNGLKTPYLLVDDRVGLVTPRVICMIINEAYYTVQEKTATREDIDLAMKLGTNYPYGPFEWCQRIGIKNVYELLDALYRDTHDERYKISALMKKEYMGLAPDA